MSVTFEQYVEMSKVHQKSKYDQQKAILAALKTMDPGYDTTELKEAFEAFNKDDMVAKATYPLFLHSGVENPEQFEKWIELTGKLSPGSSSRFSQALTEFENNVSADAKSEEIVQGMAVIIGRVVEYLYDHYKIEVPPELEDFTKNITIVMKSALTLAVGGQEAEVEG